MKNLLAFCLKLTLAFVICFGTLEIALRIHNPMPFAVRRGLWRPTREPVPSDARG